MCADIIPSRYTTCDWDAPESARQQMTDEKQPRKPDNIYKRRQWILSEYLLNINEAF